MQDRYVGDIGDFGKYGLLRFIHRETGLHLGVNWYLVEPEKVREAHNSDGSHIKYLLEPKTYRQCDKLLFNKLNSIVKPEESGAKVISKGRREVAAIERGDILSGDTVFYGKPLDFLAGKRSQWGKNGIDALADCEIVFFDPDNGFAPIKNSNFDYSVPKTRKKSVKYVYHGELVDYFERRQSLIVYQHRTREDEEKYGWRFEKINADIRKAKVFYIRFNRISARDYVFILQKDKHYQIVKKAVENFLDSDWGTSGIFSKDLYDMNKD